MTQTTIANVALKALGAGRIDDIAEYDETALDCRDVIGPATVDVLNAVVCPALVTRKALISSGDAVDGYSGAYLFPTDPPMLRPLRLESGAKFYREGARLHTNDASPVLVYVRSDYDPDDIPDYVATAIALRMAVMMAPALGKDERLPTVAALYREAIDKANSVEGVYINPPTTRKNWGQR